MDKLLIERFTQEKSAVFTDLSDKVWDFAESAFNEYQSVELHSQILEQEGFSVTRSPGGIDTAVIGSFGNGGPVIGILGEYDALPDLSQESGVTEHRPIPGQENGHGCAHNLLGGGALAAAVILKNYMTEKGLNGTIRYFGCPAEEGGSGKNFMAKESCFEGLDICLSWHPAYANLLFNQSLADIGVIFNYKGISAHAAGEPEKGRSALDAAELMNIGANYLREHIPTSARLHYAYQNAGSKAPNIVHPETEIKYSIRAINQADVLDIFERVCNIAKGAALMTGTQVEYKVISYYANFIPNDTLDEIMLKYMEEYPITYTDEEINQAKAFQQKGNAPLSPVTFMPGVMRQRIPAAASTDAGNVSWLAPTSQCFISCYAIGSTSHSWLVTAQGKSSYAHKGMLTAAKVLASVGAEVLENPEIADKAKEEHKQVLSGQSYTSVIPDDYKPYIK